MKCDLGVDKREKAALADARGVREGKLAVERRKAQSPPQNKMRSAIASGSGGVITEKDRRGIDLGFPPQDPGARAGGTARFRGDACGRRSGGWSILGVLEYLREEVALLFWAQAFFAKKACAQACW